MYKKPYSCKACMPIRCWTCTSASLWARVITLKLNVFGFRPIWVQVIGFESFLTSSGLNTLPELSTSFRIFIKFHTDFLIFYNDPICIVLSILQLTFPFYKVIDLSIRKFLYLSNTIFYMNESHWLSRHHLFLAINYLNFSYKSSNTLTKENKLYYLN